MPLNLRSSGPKTFPAPESITLSGFKRGVITLLDKSSLPKDALEEATNIFLYENGNPGPRPGVDWFGTSPVTGVSPSSSSSPSTSLSPSASPSASISLSRSPSSSLSPSASQSLSPSASRSPSASVSPSSSASRSLSPSASRSPSASQSLSPSASASPSASTSPSASASPSAAPFTIDGFDYFDNSGTSHLVMAIGGAIYRSTDDAATWSLCSGAAYTMGTDVFMNQNGKALYITTGVDPIIKYDGSTTLVSYVALANPNAPTVTGAGAGTTYTHYYKVSAVNTVGFTTASASANDTLGVARSGFDSTTNFMTISGTVDAGATRVDIYYAEDDINYFYLDSAIASSGSFSYKDDGAAIISPSITAPLDNTTTGPKVAELVNVGSRMYGTRDSVHPYRIWFTGAGSYAGYFSSAYDGGYLDWQNGGKFKPVKVVDYRDGKGTPLATIFTKSADGQGSVLQMSLDTLTVGDLSITVPSAYQLPGSRGTAAPNSVVNVLNDYMFYNQQAFYNLGSRAQFLNLLSTDESSANIRPTVKQVSSSGETEIASVYFNDGTGSRVYFSVPIGSSENNYTMIYDTDRKAWIPKAFDIGFKKFLRYTDTGGVRRLLCYRNGDSGLSEISSDFGADYGVAFETVLSTGLYPTVKDRFEFLFAEEGEIELSNPNGDISVELLGIERANGFGTIAAKTITSTAATTTTGWDTFAWDTTGWDDTSTAPTLFSESSLKRYFTLQKELNAIQWRITTKSVKANYTMRTLQVWGTPTLSGKPREWRLTT